MNNKVLDISFAKLAAMLLPMPLRKPRIMALAAILAKPFASLLAALSAFRQDKLQRLRYNGQVCRLEYCLNNRFGDIAEVDDINYARRIRVLDGTERDGTPYIIYHRAVSARYDRPKRRGIDPQITLNHRSVNCQTFYAFIIECPVEFLEKDKGTQAYTSKLNEIAAVVNTYKTQGKTWLLKEKQ